MLIFFCILYQVCFDSAHIHLLPLELIFSTYSLGSLSSSSIIICCISSCFYRREKGDGFVVWSWAVKGSFILDFCYWGVSDILRMGNLYRGFWMIYCIEGKRRVRDPLLDLGYWGVHNAYGSFIYRIFFYGVVFKMGKGGMIWGMSLGGLGSITVGHPSLLPVTLHPY